MRTKKQRTIQRRGRKRTRKIQHAGNKPFSIFYTDTLVQGQLLTISQTAKKPAVQIPAGFYLVMYDPDAPAKDWIHWIATQTRDILPYEGPNPPKGTGTHHYIFVLVAGNPPPPPNQRGSQNAAKLAPPGKRVSSAEFLVSAENSAT